MSVDAVVGVELLATTLAGKHMATVLPNFVLARHCQRLESFVTYITGVNPLSLAPCTFNMCLDRILFFISSCHSGCTVLANREGWRVAGDLVPQETPDNS